MQLAAVIFAIDRQTSRPEASLDLIFEARPRAILEHRIGTGAKRKHFADDVDSLAQPIGGTERPEILATVFDNFPRDHDSRPRMIGDLGAPGGFIVLEANVVARLVLLDEVVFEDQRFLFSG